MMELKRMVRKLFLLAMISAVLISFGCEQKPVTSDNHNEETPEPDPIPDPVSGDKTFTVDGVSFVMKSLDEVTDGNLGAEEHFDNKPRTVSLSSYLVAETQITQELWEKIMGNNPSKFKDIPAENGEAPKKRPVENINWYQAITFCNKLSIKQNLEPCYTVTVSGEVVDFSKITFNEIPKAKNEDWSKASMDMSKNGFRLPTETEWEWAAKGGKNEKWAGTDEKAKLKEYAWYKDEDGGDSGKKTHEVKKKQPNGYGLYDMSGNVYEWCWDRYDADKPPQNGNDPTGSDSGIPRVTRGGSFGEVANNTACAYRFSIPPWYVNRSLGFRVVCRP